MPEEILNRILYYSNIRCHIDYHNILKTRSFYSLKCYEMI